MVRKNLVRNVVVQSFREGNALCTRPAIPSNSPLLEAMPNIVVQASQGKIASCRLSNPVCLCRRLRKVICAPVKCVNFRIFVEEGNGASLGAHVGMQPVES